MFDAVFNNVRVKTYYLYCDVIMVSVAQTKVVDNQIEFNKGYYWSRLLDEHTISCNNVQGRVSLVGNSSLPVLNGSWFEFLRVRCYRIVFLRERVELEPLDKSPVRAELSSVEILLVEGISVLKKYLISVSLLYGVQEETSKIKLKK